jgi:hypothetical protein
MSDDSTASQPTETPVDQDANQSPQQDGGSDQKGEGQKGDDTAGKSEATADHDPDAVTSGGDGFREATSSAGAGTQRRNHLLAAQHILGDQVGVKNVYLGGGERRIRLSRLSSQLAAEVRNAYVKPTEWGDLHSRFQKQNTIVLCGPAGHGRQATAVRLLQAAQIETIYELEPDVDLGALAELLDAERRKPDRLKPGAAFMLHEPPDIARLRASVLHGLQEAMGDTGRLVLTIGLDATIMDDEVNRHVVSLPPAPKLSDILRAHLRWHVGDPRADADLARDGVQDLVDELLNDGATCVIAAQLAEWFSWEPEDGFDLDRVRRGMQRRSADTFAEWFDGLPDLSTRTLGIALAALDGLPYADVARAATSLHNRLDQVQKIALVPTAEDATQTSSQYQLRNLHATTSPGEVRLTFGRVPATMVRYRRDTMANQVLDRAWHGYQIQDELLSWLRDLIDDPSEQVRLFGGTTLGVLATLSFDRVWYVLESLAGDDLAHRREAAAVALKAVAADDRLRPAVASLVRRWYGGANRTVQAAAARAHGMVLGQRDLPSTLDSLGRLAALGHGRVAVAIGEALADLIAADPETAARAIYPALLSWLDDYKRAPTTHLAFLIVAVSTVTDVYAGGVEDDGTASAPTVWPTLLHLATRHSDLRTPLSIIWHRVLDEGVMFDEAERVLTGWAGRGEGDDQILDAFTRMARAVGDHGRRTRASLLSIANEWVDPDRLSPLPKAASAVAAVLATREETLWPGLNSS